MSAWTVDQSTYNKMAQPMILARIPETPENTQWEPQRVRVLENAGAQLICDNASRISGNAFNFTVRLGVAVQNIRRVGIEAICIASPATNVNTQNNSATFIISSGPYAGTQVVSIVVGQYTSGTALVTALNTAFNPIGITATWLALTNRIQLASSNPFYIDPNSGFIKYGGDLHGLQQSTTPALTITGEVAYLVFSRYYGISCQQLTNYEKNNSSASDRVNSDLVVFYSNNAGFIPFNETWQYLGASNILYRNFEPQTQINELTFSVRDRWGNDPTTYALSPNSWPCTIIVRTNI